MRQRLISILVAGLFTATPLALAADGGLTWSGSASLGLRHTGDKATDSSKLNEYRDLGSTAPLTVFDVRGRGDDYYLNFFGENLGRDDQYIDLRGGQYGVFKYQLYSNELRHNFGSGAGARSPYSGIGGSTLTATFPSLNPSTWNTFDHSYDRRDLGGMFEFSFESPWYVRFEGNEVRRKGINVFAGAQGTSPGSGFVDLPAPIDYKTNNYSVEGGYQGKTTHFAVNGMYSKFSNDNDVLSWSNGFFSPLNPLNRDTTVLPADNELMRISANGNIRKLPGDSTLAGRLTYSKLTNDVPVQPTMLAAGSTNPSTAASSPLFHGEIKKTTFGLSLSSHPLRDLDTRVYWNWAKEDNDSTRIAFSPAQNSGLLAGGIGPNCNNGSIVPPLAAATPCVPEVFAYKKNNLGVEAGYRLNRENKLTGGFDYYDMERERVDFTENKDRKLFAEWKNSSLDALTARFKYQYLTRRSTWSVDPAIIANNPIEQFVRRFDLANVNQNLFKVVLDASPMPFLDLGLEAIYKKNDYKDTALGRTEDERQEYYLSLSYGDPKSFRFMVFADVEFTQYDSAHRVGFCGTSPSDPPQSGSPPLVPCSPLPAGIPPAPAIHSSYSWSAKNKDKAWQVGLGADWLPRDRLSLKSSLIWARTRGTTDFAAQAGTVLAAPFLPITNFDNTTRVALNLKGTYKYSKQWEFTGGYAFEKYRYSDIGYDGFGYTAANSATTPDPAQTAYMTGQFAFQPYTASIFYVISTYKF